MMQIEVIQDSRLTPATRSVLARYRYQVFVQTLGWPLDCPDGLEQDEFDTPHAVHVMAMTRGGTQVGYARLLPTTRPYLLETHFPQLLGDAPPPRDVATWELTRYAACGAGVIDVTAQTRIGKRVLLEAARYVEACDGREMVFCTTAPVERLAGRWGVDIRRLGVRQEGGQRLVAAMIRCNSLTFEALRERPAALPTAPLTWVAHRPSHAANHGIEILSCA
jgi:acyl homoserine lactone synthase